MIAQSALHENMHKKNNVSLWIAAQAVVDQKTTCSASYLCLNCIIELINNLATDTGGMDLFEQLEHALHHSTLREHYKKERGEKGPGTY